MYSFSWLIMSCLKRNYRGSSNLTKSSKFKIIVKKVKRNLKVQIFILVWGVHEVNLKLPGSNMKRKVSNMFIWKKKKLVTKNHYDALRANIYWPITKYIRYSSNQCSCSNSLCPPCRGYFFPHFTGEEIEAHRG